MGRKELKRVKLGTPTHEEILFSRDGARVYIPNIDTINVLDMRTLEVTGHLTSGKHPEGMAWSAVSPSTR